MKKLTLENCKKIELPKWPQMKVTGVSVTEDQAKEIIRRTDNFLVSGNAGNDRKFAYFLRRLFGLPFDEYECHTLKEREIIIDQKAKNIYYQIIDANEKIRHKLWGCINNSYVQSNWIQNCFIFGSHGFCHPDGKIGFVDNIGKWPDTEEIIDDWKKITKAFPFLDLKITIHDEENWELESLGFDPKNPNTKELFERKIIFGLIIKNGKITFCSKQSCGKDFHIYEPFRSNKVPIDEFDKNFKFDKDFELGIPYEWLLEYAKLAVQLGITNFNLDSATVEDFKKRNLKILKTKI